MPRLVLALTDPRSALLVRGQIGFLRRRGFDVHLVTGPGEPATTLAAAEGATHHAIDIARDIAPSRDRHAIVTLTRLLKRLAPDLVDGSTPKAGLLTMLAATAARVPVRVHTLRGLRVETARGLRRALLWGGHRVTCELAHQVICVGPSLRARAVELGVVRADKAVVLGSGSGNGVDLGVFDPDTHAAAGQRLRASLGIELDAPLVVFVGRLVTDKGLPELARAWPMIGRRAQLLIVGPDDPTDPIAPEVRAAFVNDRSVHLLGDRPDVAAIYAASDLVVLPSRREGLANVLLEAGAMERPAVATDIPGCVDVIEPEVTGTLVAPGDASALAAAIARYIDDPDLRARHGAAAHERIARDFRMTDVWTRVADAYQRLLR